MRKNIEGWIIREVKQEEYQLVVDIYNSNPYFLKRHLGKESINIDFVAEEVSTMKEYGFKPCVIVRDTCNVDYGTLQKGNEQSGIVGVLDYKYKETKDELLEGCESECTEGCSNACEDECIIACKEGYIDECYLSLMGLGNEIYKSFEYALREKGCKFIRIDVVNDFKENVVTFWEQLGFQACEEIKLTWGNKTSLAVVMRKNLLL